MKKRVLSFILVLSMILGSIGMVFAAPANDIAGHKNEKAILRLNKLGIVEGDDRGFAPDDNITRAEYAVMVVRALGLEGSANVSKGDTPFTDVTVEAGYEWASGAINVATKLGYIQGYGGGKFGPADNIRYEDAITLIVRVLGYEPAVETKGGYPVGYLVVAEQDLDITDHVDGLVGLPATRGAVFQLLDNSLTKPLMVQVGYGDEAKYVISGQKGSEVEKQTILTNKLGLEVVEEEVVTEIARVGSLKKDRIKIGNKTYKVVGEVDYEAVFGTEVEAWLNDDGEVVYVEIASEDVYFDALEDVTRHELTLVDAGEDYDLAEDVVFYVNGSKLKSSEIRELSKEEYGYAKVVLNDDGDVAFVDAYTWDDFIVVEKVSGNYIYGYGEEINVKDFAIVKDGKTIDLDDLEKGDILFYNTEAEYAEVYNDSVEGEISRIYEDRIRVEGKDYKIASAKYINEDDDIVDLDSSKYKDVVETMQDAGKVAVFLNRTGDMVFLSGDIDDLVTSSDYVFVHFASDAGDHYSVRTQKYLALDVVNAEGKLVKYDIEDPDEDNTVDDILYKEGSGAPQVWDSADLIGKVVEISLDKDGDVEKILILDKEDADGVKTSAKYVDVYRIDSDAIVFLNDDYDGSDAKDIDVSVLNELDFEKILTGDAYIKGDKAVAFVVDDSDKGEGDVHLTVATAAGNKVSGKHIYTLSLILDGKKVQVDTKEGITGDARSVEKGDLLKVTFDKKNISIVEVDKIANVNDASLSGQAVKGSASEVKTKDLKVGDDTYKLGADAIVVDSTDKYKVISLSSLKKGDKVAVLLIKSGSSYAEVIVKLDKDDSGDNGNNGDNGGTVYVIDAYTTAFDGRLTLEDIDGNKANFLVNDFEAVKANGTAVSKSELNAWLASTSRAGVVVEIDEDNKLNVKSAAALTWIQDARILAANTADVNTAIEAIEAAAFGPVAQADVNTEVAATSAVEAVIAGLDLPEGVTTTVEPIAVTPFKAAQAESAVDAGDGVDGFYKFTVEVTTGAGATDFTDDTVEITLVITATVLSNQ